MKIAVFLFVLSTLSILVYSRLIEVPFGASDSIASPSDLLHRPNDVIDIGNVSPINDKQPVQIAGVYWDPHDIADDATWQRYKKKGNWLRCLMEMSDEVAGREWPNFLGRNPASAQSPWKGTLQEELKTWFWHDGHYDAETGCDFSDSVVEAPLAKNRIGAALTALGLSLKPVEQGGKNRCHSVEHFDENCSVGSEDELMIDEQFYKVNGKRYPATGAYYRFAMNAEQGAAAARNLGDHIAKEKLPALIATSDILAGCWLRNPNPKNIRYWFGSDIVNVESLPVITRILVDNGHGAGIPFWPGLQLDAPSDEYMALLGTPVGASKAFFLTQHKAELGIKHIPSITIFRDAVDPRVDDAPPEIRLLFRFEDVPSDEMLPDDMDVVDEGSAGPLKRLEVKKKRDSMLGLDLGRDVSRLHTMSVDEQGETVLQSGEFRREL